MKLIIYCTGTPLLNGHARGNFLWSEKHQCYIWKGRELEAAEFNGEVVQAMTEHRKLLQPMVKVLEAEAPAKPSPLSVEQAVAFLKTNAPLLLAEPESAPV